MLFWSFEWTGYIDPHYGRRLYTSFICIIVNQSVKIIHFPLIVQFFKPVTEPCRIELMLHSGKKDKILVVWIESWGKRFKAYLSKSEHGYKRCCWRTYPRPPVWLKKHRLGLCFSRLRLSLTSRLPLQISQRKDDNELRGVHRASSAPTLPKRHGAPPPYLQPLFLTVTRVTSHSTSPPVSSQGSPPPPGLTTSTTVPFYDDCFRCHGDAFRVAAWQRITAVLLLFI